MYNNKYIFSYKRGVMKDFKYYLLAFTVLALLSAAIGLTVDKLMNFAPKINVHYVQNKTAKLPTPQVQNKQVPEDDTEVKQMLAQIEAARQGNAMPEQEVNTTADTSMPSATDSNPAAQNLPREANTPAQSAVTIYTVPQYPQSGKAEDLYKSALPAIRKILQAQASYYQKNQTYTTNINALGLIFKDIQMQVPVDNTSRIYLNNGFYYVITDKLVAVYYGNAKFQAEFYHIDFFYNGDILCVATNLQAGESCKALGGDFPMANKRIASWIEYSLPKGFI